VVDDVDALMAEHAAETQADIGQVPAEPEAKPAKAPRKKAVTEKTGEHGRTKASRKRAHSTKPVADAPADIAAIAEENILNGSGGTMAHALLAATGK
jgi:hypothetical protein